jgi:hypothetical protein
MTFESVREALERNQVAIHFIAVVAAAAVALAWPASGALEPLINPALALMVFVTFLRFRFRTLAELLRMPGSCRR